MMNNELVGPILDALTQHMPTSATWMPLAGIGGSLLFGLLLLAKGARFAPVMAALVFLGLGGIGGSFLGVWLGAPIWLSIGCGGVIGFIVGLAFFRLWLAVLTGGCFALASLTLYSVNVLPGPLVEYSNQPVAEVSLATAEENTASAKLSRLLAYFGEKVPSFKTSVFAIVLSTLAAGIVFGLLLPKTARALWAASAGTVFFASSLLGILQVVAPNGQEWLTSLGAWSWGILGTIWVCSLVYNLYDCRTKRPKKKRQEEDAEHALA